MRLTLAVDSIAEAIHDSRYGEGAWAKLPQSATNPSRFYGRKQALAVAKLLGAEESVVSETFDFVMEEGENAIAASLAASHAKNVAEAEAKAKEKAELKDAAATVFASMTSGDDDDDDET